MRNKTKEINSVCGNAMEEIQCNAEIINELKESNGAKQVFTGIISKALGNKGYICSLTVECMNNCR